jgi:hypothetical protein
MKKIALVIEKCNECPHRKKFVETCGNTDYLQMCCYSDDTFGENAHIPFLLNRCCSKGDEHFIEIPENCPLETYQ